MTNPSDAPSKAYGVATAHRFWRDASLPHLELRELLNSADARYRPHSHETFSIGLIRAGAGNAMIDGRRFQLRPGSVVIINPGVTHACNPNTGTAWSFRMLFVEASWIAAFQQSDHFRPFDATILSDPAVYGALDELCSHLFDKEGSADAKDTLASAFFRQLCKRLDVKDDIAALHPRLEKAAEFLKLECDRAVPLSELCELVDLSPAHLIRLFKARFGMTPHSFQVNRRVHQAEVELRAGRSIAEAALSAGFADQAHLQRAFKLLRGTTPRRFKMIERRPS